MIICGDALTELKQMPNNGVDCCITSPPYWGLRDYGHCDQIGLEKSPHDYIAALVEVFAQIRRVLKPTGTCWVNIGDSYATGAGSARNPGGKCFGKTNVAIEAGAIPRCQPNRMPIEGLKTKEVIGIPWRLAFALQAEGWYLRQDLIWHKPNPMPESVKDRFTKAHEYIFFLTKSPHYTFDFSAIQEPAASVRPSGNGFAGRQGGSRRCGPQSGGQGSAAPWKGATRTKRSVWSIVAKPSRENHFATFPEELVAQCLLAGCPGDGLVIDPFFGSGTVGVVARAHGRKFIGIELNPEYIEIAMRRMPDNLFQPLTHDK